MGKCWNQGKNTCALTWLAGSCNRTLKKGLCGQDVVYIQLLLKEAGFNPIIVMVGMVFNRICGAVLSTAYRTACHRTGR